MRSYIVGVKRQIFTIVKHISKINSGATLRLAIVAYRDFGPARLNLQTSDFVVADKKGVEAFEAFVSGVRATSSLLSLSCGRGPSIIQISHGSATGRSFLKCC